jgi:hypothetical protein
VGPDVAVEAMMSNNGHVFYGDLRSHERVCFHSDFTAWKLQIRPYAQFALRLTLCIFFLDVGVYPVLHIHALVQILPGAFECC